MAWPKKEPGTAVEPYRGGLPAPRAGDGRLSSRDGDSGRALWPWQRPKKETGGQQSRRWDWSRPAAGWWSRPTTPDASDQGGWWNRRPALPAAAPEPQVSRWAQTRQAASTAGRGASAAGRWAYRPSDPEGSSWWGTGSQERPRRTREQREAGAWW